jgi:hypothetical protein
MGLIAIAIGLISALFAAIYSALRERRHLRYSRAISS